MKNKIILHYKNFIAYICLEIFLINVKTKMNCKQSYFFIMFSMVGRIWIRDGPRVENHWYKACNNVVLCNSYILLFLRATLWQIINLHIHLYSHFTQNSELHAPS